MLIENIQTHEREEMVDITSRIREALRKKGLSSGLCVVYVPHTTAGIAINENADPDVPQDILMGLRRIVPLSFPFQHTEGNADAHLKAVLVGSSIQIPIHEGLLSLGTWQGIFFCEFDGPRLRRIMIQFIPDTP